MLNCWFWSVWFLGCTLYNNSSSLMYFPNTIIKTIIHISMIKYYFQYSLQWWFGTYKVSFSLFIFLLFEKKQWLRLLGKEAWFGICGLLELKWCCCIFSQILNFHWEIIRYSDYLYLYMIWPSFFTTFNTFYSFCIFFILMYSWRVCLIVLPIWN